MADWTQTKDEQDQLAQASAMMAKRLFENKSIKDLQTEFHVSKSTVMRRLKQARNESIIRDARQVVIDDLLATALITMKQAMESDDKKLAVQVALKIADGLEIFTDHDKAAEVRDKMHRDTVNAMEETFEVFRARVTRRGGAADSDTPLDIEAAAEGEIAGGDSEGAETVRVLPRGDSELPASTTPAEVPTPPGETARQASVPGEPRPNERAIHVDAVVDKIFSRPGWKHES